MLRRADDEELFLRYRERGDARALARLVERTGPELFRLASWLAGDPHLAEDLVQTTYLTALERADSYVAGRPVLPWLMGILANRARHLRRQRARSDARAPDGDVLAGEPSRAAEARELEEQLERRLDGFEPPYREVLHLHLLHGLSAKEIAAALGRPPGTVRTQVVRGLERLRASLPAGFAVSGLAFVLPSRRALAALRETVLAAASPPVGASAAPIMIAGGLAVKAIGATLVVAAALVALFVVRAREGAERAPVEVGAGAATPTQVDVAPSEVEQAVLAASSERTALETAPPPAGASDTTLVVRARYGAGGPPAVGATVSIAPEVRDAELFEREAACDEHGVARFVEVTPGSYRVRGAQGGRATVEVLADATTEVELVIPAGVRVDGVVVDPDGRPIAGARVWVSAGRNWPNQGRIATETADDGTFTLANVERGRLMSAYARDFEPARLVAVAGDGERATMRLELNAPGRALIGRVVGDDGQPVAGAVVQVGWTQSFVDMRGMQPSFPTTRLRSDAEGLFRADGVDDRFLEVPLWVRAAGYAVHLVDVDLSEPGDVHVTVELARGATVRGRATDAGGSPLADVQVSAFQDAVEPAADVMFLGPSWARRATVTGVDGEYELANVHTGPVRMQAELEKLRSVEELALTEGELREWDATLLAGGAITGVVTDERGASLVGWDVWARAGKGVRDPANATTDDVGAFRLEDCDDAEYELFTRTSSMDQGTASLSGVRPSAGPVRLVVPDAAIPSAWIAGRVELPDGRLVEDLRVVLTLKTDGTWANGASASTGGEFELGPVIPGTYEVRVALGGGMSALDLGLYELAAGAHLDLGTHRFEESGSVHLSVVDEAGRPVPEGQFTLMRDGDMWGVMLELRKGEARSTPVQPGDYRLTPWGAEPVLVSMPVTVRAGVEEQVQMTLPRGVRRSVRYPAASSERQFFTLTWLDGEGAVIASQTSYRENVGEPYESVKRFLPGDYVARMTMANGASAEASFTVDDVDRAEVVFELPVPAGW